MKKLMIFLLVAAILAPLIQATNVSLVAPSNGAIFTNPDFINFICSSDDSAIIRLQLYSDISGLWQKVAEKTGSDPNYVAANTDHTFSLFDSNIGFKTGTYRWICKAVSDINGVIWAPNNRTIELQVINNPPVCTTAFPAVTLNKNTAKTNVLDLNNHIDDPEDDVLTFTFSGMNNIDITLKSNGFIDISPKQDRIATDNIYVTVRDGKNDDVQCGPLAVTILNTGGSTTNTSANTTTTNTAPDISDIPDQSKVNDVSFWEIDLDDYVTDDGSKSDLVWTVEGVDSDIAKVSINSISHRVKFEPVSAGISTITFVVKDTAGLSDDDDVKITITGAETDVEDEIEEEKLKIEEHTPGSSDPKVGVGETIAFFVDVNKDNSSIIWYVNGEQAKEGSDNFEFTPEEIGEYKVTVSAEKDGETDDYEWDLSVGEATIDVLATSETICGNNITDEGENCGNCAEDVKCSEGEECIEGACVVSRSLTGFAIKDLSGGNLIAAIVVGVIAALLIVLGVVRARNKKKTRHMKLTSFGGEREVRKKEVILQAKEGVKEAPSGLEPVIGFVQSGLASGDSEKTIKKALLRSGWSKKQIKGAFNSIRK